MKATYNAAVVLAAVRLLVAVVLQNVKSAAEAASTQDSEDAAGAAVAARGDGMGLRALVASVGGGRGRAGAGRAGAATAGAATVATVYIGISETFLFQERQKVPQSLRFITAAPNAKLAPSTVARAREKRILVGWKLKLMNEW